MRNCAGQSLATSAATCVPRCDAGAFRQVRMRRCTRVLAWPSAGQPWRDTLRCMLLWTLLAEKPPNLVFFVMLNAGDVLLDNCFSVSPYILGDAGYPCLPRLITPFSAQGAARDLHGDEGKWNFKHSSARTIIERAFGRLKARFRILLHVMVLDWTLVTPIILACFILHNFLIDDDTPLDVIVAAGEDPAPVDDQNLNTDYDLLAHDPDSGGFKRATLFNNFLRNKQALTYAIGMLQVTKTLPARGVGSGRL